MAIEADTQTVDRPARPSHFTHLRLLPVRDLVSAPARPPLLCRGQGALRPAAPLPILQSVLLL